MTSARRSGIVAAALIGALFAGGCASVTDGHGSAAVSPSGSRSTSRPDFPSTSPTPSAPASSRPAPTARAPSEPVTNSRREQALTTASAGQDVSVLVAVPGGYEAE